MNFSNPVTFVKSRFHCINSFETYCGECMKRLHCMWKRISFKCKFTLGLHLCTAESVDMLRREFVVAKCLTAPQNCKFPKIHPGTLAG